MADLMKIAADDKFALFYCDDVSGQFRGRQVGIAIALSYPTYNWKQVKVVHIVKRWFWTRSDGSSVTSALYTEEEITEINSRYNITPYTKKLEWSETVFEV